MEQLVGQRLGRYWIDELIGHGNRAWLYRATDSTTRREVALRVLDRTLGGDASFFGRFRQAMLSVAALRHPNLLPILDHGVHDSLAFLVRPLLGGSTLRTRFGYQLSLAETSALLRPIAGALDYAHGQGIVHGDVKPGSILLPTPDKPILADLGTAPVAAQLNNMIATAKGQQFGTPEYLAPEQVRGTAIDSRTDLYALGVILYESLTGRPPFRAERPTDTPRQIALAHLAMQPPSPRSLNPTLSPTVEQVLFQALEKRPERRYPTAMALFDALDAAQVGQLPFRTAIVGPSAPQADQQEHRPAAKSARGWSRTRI